MLNVLPVVRWVEWFLSPSLAPDSKNGKRWLGGIPPPQNRGWLDGWMAEWMKTIVEDNARLSFMLQLSSPRLLWRRGNILLDRIVVVGLPACPCAPLVRDID
jgi:hypothetical protein